MRYLDQSWTRIFLAPPNDPAGGGNPAANQGGGQQQQDSSTAFKDPTANIDLDDLAPDVRAVIEESRKGFASLQEQAAKAEEARKLEEKRRVDFQSKFDQTRVQLEKITGGQQQQADPKVAQQQAFEQILIKKGVTPEGAKIQAEIMLEMMGTFGETLKDQIGRDLMPIASTIINREAEFSWQQAVAMDKVGALQDPQIAQHVWEQVQGMVQNGQQVTPLIVQNLAGMAYFAALQEGKIQPQQQQQNNVTTQQHQLPNVGRLTFSGAGATPLRPPQVDPNAPRYQLDSATDAALQVCMSQWAKGQGGVKAPGLRQPVKGGR